MSIKLTHGEYVKFVRTTSSVWANVSDQQKNSDTLYFVLNATRTAGDLYLGSTLISKGLTESLTLSDLTDVLSYSAVDLTDGALLTWNDTNGQWEPTPLVDVVTLIASSLEVMTGATANAAGESGLVPVPAAGTQNWFLAGSGQWVNPTPVIQQVINTNASNWFGADWDSNVGSLANNQTVRSIAANEVAKIVANAPRTLDTLEEIANWIENQPNTSSFISRITYLENRVINGVPADPETGEAAIPSIVTQISTLNNNYSGLDSRVTAVENTLKWQDMSEE